MNTAVSVQSDNRVNPQNSDLEKTIPAWIVWMQCICFAVLYAIWNYPLTNFLSDVCMIIGALLSVYVLYINRSFFKSNQSIPFWLLVTLLVWIVFHLLFLSNNFPLQLRELTNIWKRAAIAIIFALGFGMTLASSPPRKGYWALFYLGMAMPTIIFLVKYVVNTNAAAWGLVVPDYFRLYGGRDSVFYMYKTDYVSFCLPALAISLAQLKRNLQAGYVFVVENGIYILAVLGVLTTFYLDNVKNGMAYSVMLIAAFTSLVLNTELNKWVSSSFQMGYLKRILIKMLAIVLLSLLALPIITRHIEQNPSWKSLLADSKVAVKVDEIDTWKYWGAKGYPLNELGNPVSPTNYERLAWGIIGLRLLQENPLGYGLVENSFGYLTKLKWPDSLLRQSHSGWLDLALGIGIPGILLLLSAMGMAMDRLKNAAVQTKPQDDQSSEVIWSTRIIWILWAIILLWCTSEISLKIHLIALLFWVSLAIGVTGVMSAQGVAGTKDLPRDKFGWPPV